MSKLYEAVKEKYPDKSNAAICRMMGVGHGALGHIKNGKPGVPVAKWMSENHVDCGHLYIDAMVQLEASQMKGAKKKGSKIVLSMPLWKPPQPERPERDW